MRVFTIKKDSKRIEGASVGFLNTRGRTIPAILVGGKGDSECLGVLPVKLIRHRHYQWKEEVRRANALSSIHRSKTGRSLYTKYGETTLRVNHIELTTNESGNPKAVELTSPNEDQSNLVVVESCDCIAGEPYRWKCNECGRVGNFNTYLLMPKRCPECNAIMGRVMEIFYYEFPAIERILAHGAKMNGGPEPYKGYVIHVEHEELFTVIYPEDAVRSESFHGDLSFHRVPLMRHRVHVSGGMHPERTI